MSKSDSAAHESAATTRRIDPKRTERALTESMAVREHAPAQYLVARDGDDHDEHLVDVKASGCDCEDAHFRNVVCVHMVRASLHHAYRSSPNTRLVARVLAAVGELGCPHGVAGCGGPTDAGQRGLPCEGCISATPGHWVVYQRLANGVVVEPDVDRGEGITTDGGRRHTPPQSTCDHGITETDYTERSDGQHKVIVCATCNLILEDCGVPEPDACTDGGTVTLHPCSTCDGQAEGDDEQCPECQRRGVPEVDETPL